MVQCTTLWFVNTIIVVFRLGRSRLKRDTKRWSMQTTLNWSRILNRLNVRFATLMLRRERGLSSGTVCTSSAGNVTVAVQPSQSHLLYCFNNIVFNCANKTLTQGIHILVLFIMYLNVADDLYQKIMSKFFSVYSI